MAAKKTIKKEIDLSGTSRQLSEPERRFLVNFREDRIAAEAGLSHFSRALNDARKKIWETLFEFHPDLENYHTNYNFETGKVEILKKKTD